MKFNLRKKAQLVPERNMTEDRDNTSYYGLLTINTVGIYFFLVQINYIEVHEANFGNAYLHLYPKENIYTVKGPGFGEW